MSSPGVRSKAQCPVFGVVPGAPVIGLGFLLILFGGVLLLTGRFLHATIPPALLFIGFGAVLIVLGFRNWCINRMREKALILQGKK